MSAEEPMTVLKQSDVVAERRSRWLPPNLTGVRSTEGWQSIGRAGGNGKPSRARLDDLLLGGKDHQVIDRTVAAELKKVPLRFAIGSGPRDFIERAVQFWPGPPGA
ncbi:hypothetical protein E6W39_00015 [Kitasatospora acidiphila]|uniref:Uncharacterized protein n=1 Tax=Kitasatospora acidiphila TaxID=2567942 RepID=A0A540WG33_9ACTN|nr:SAM-dependent methyltransferase [Kitasatospora acidiphila]TQF07993.1 hypothetical protein E6W39_00015 [Kitasatospora acidiphila]